ncbi:MAG: phosphate signaling complex PhoU family protein [Actinomycetes bacterium]
MTQGNEPEPVHATRAGFHRSLDQIDDAFVEAGAIVAESLPRLTRAFLAGNRESIEDARAMASDVQGRCHHVEESGFVMLAREAPVAGDLRRLVALLRLVVDVDRSAALLKHVSETLDRFDPRDLPEAQRQQLTDLGERATDVFRRGLDAWRSKDALAITEVDVADEGVDRLQQVILDHAAQVDNAGDEMLVLGLIARYYERIADHGVALARDATFVVTGERVTLPSRSDR